MDAGESAVVPEEPRTACQALARRVEALLFVASTPLTVDQLAQALETTPSQVEGALAVLAKSLHGRGIILQQAHGHVQLATAPDLAGDVERFLGLDLTARLSPAALETLAIIAYRQPVTRAQVEAVRGVNSDSVLRTLLSKGLIEEVGRLETVGRPILYGTTLAFLQYFGLKDLSELPPLEQDETRVLAETLEGALHQVARGEKR